MKWRLISAVAVLVGLFAVVLYSHQTERLTAPASHARPPASAVYSFDVDPGASFQAGPDGSLWFTPGNTGRELGEVGLSDKIRIISITGTTHRADQIDGVSASVVWATDTHSRAVLRVTKSGRTTAYQVKAKICDTTLSSSGLWLQEHEGSCDTSYVTDQTGPSWVGFVGNDGRFFEEQLPAGRYICGQVPAPDGSLWFLALQGNNCEPYLKNKHPEPSWVGRITANGRVTFHPLPGKSTPMSIVAGSNGTLWLTDEQRFTFRRITMPYKLATFHIPGADFNPFITPVLGSDGGLWFVDIDYFSSYIGEITPAGKILKHETTDNLSLVAKFIVGGCKDLWLSDSLDYLSHIAPSGAETTYINEPLTNPQPTLTGAVAVAPDGSAWYEKSDGGGKLSRITPHGVLSNPVTLPAGGMAQGIAFDGAGNLWVAVTPQDSGDTIPSLNNDRGTVDLVVLPNRVSAFSVPGGLGGLGAAVSASDGAVWTIDTAGNALVRRSNAGAVREYVIPTAGSRPRDLAAGPGGVVWFTEYAAGKVGRATPSGHIVEYALPQLLSEPTGIAIGADGNTWFAESGANRIGRISPDGRTREFPTGMVDGQPTGIAAGPDGNVWFTDDLGGRIGRITSGGKVTAFKLPAANSSPYQITAGPDGALWFTEYGSNQIGRITIAGVVSEFAVPTTNSYPDDIASGADGALWFTERDGNKVGRITPAGTITEYPPANLNHPEGIAAGGDAVWFTENGGNWLTRIATPMQGATSAGSTEVGGQGAGVAAKSRMKLPAGCSS